MCTVRLPVLMSVPPWIQYYLMLSKAPAVGGWPTLPHEEVRPALSPSLLPHVSRGSYQALYPLPLNPLRGEEKVLSSASPSIYWRGRMNRCLKTLIVCLLNEMLFLVLSLPLFLEICR